MAEKSVGCSTAPMAAACGTSISVNLRDLAVASMGLLQPGIVYRSSEIYSSAAAQQMQLKTIIDLRQTQGPCKNLKKKRQDQQTSGQSTGGSDNEKTQEETEDGDASSSATSTLSSSQQQMGPLSPSPSSRGGEVSSSSALLQPRSCSACDKKVLEKHGLEATVVHADLIHVSVGLAILLGMPWRVRLQALQAWAQGQGAEPVLTLAVADPLIFGYKKLYRTILDHSQRGIALAFRVMTERANFPILIQCIHGKDRTGIIVMLLLLLCGVPRQQIVDDYAKSGTILKQSAIIKELHLDEYLTRDQVLSADAQTMEETIEYLEKTWGSAEMYLQQKCGLSEEEISRIKENVKVQQPA